MKFSLKRPCKECPFLKGKRYLHPERAESIANYALKENKTFVCHKTIDASEQQHCAGALIMSEKHGRPNAMHQIAQRLGIYRPENLDLSADVYANAEDMMKGHAR